MSDTEKHAAHIVPRPARLEDPSLDQIAALSSKPSSEPSSSDPALSDLERFRFFHHQRFQARQDVLI
jgi:hypothetical protein